MLTTSDLWVRQSIMLLWSFEGRVCRLPAFAAQLHLKTGPRDTRHRQSGGWSFGNFDLAVEEVFAGGEELETFAKVGEA